MQFGSVVLGFGLAFVVSTKVIVGENVSKIN